jgi:hypothetical protein
MGIAPVSFSRTRRPQLPAPGSTSSLRPVREATAAAMKSTLADRQFLDACAKFSLLGSIATILASG